MKGLARVLFWAVLSAAFVGPGTVTTCARAGAEFGTSLLWAVLFSIVACFVLQEMAARLTLVTGDSLGRALRVRWGSGAAGLAIVLLVLGAVLLGAAAYQAGNLLGAREGLALLGGRGGALGVLMPAAIAFFLLWFAPAERVAQALGIVVAGMGVCFFVAALPLVSKLPNAFADLLLPGLPAGAEWTVVALVGTTVVPYNLFLGSSLAHAEYLEGFRWPLAIAIGLGGLVSAAILVVGTAAGVPFSFEGLGEALASELGPWARGGFAAGLFAAGLSSAITAPLAAALTARALFLDPARRSKTWREDGAGYRAVWISVLAIGALSAVLARKPVGAIVAAQAFNGLVLPLVAGFLLYAAADRSRMGDAVNGPVANSVGFAVWLVSAGLGLLGLWKAASALGLVPPPG